MRTDEGQDEGQDEGGATVDKRTPVADRDAWEIVIDCSACPIGRTEACADCIVAFVHEGAGEAVVYDVEEERALRSLARAGLLQDVRYRAESG